MSQVYIFLADGFEELEGLTAVDLLRRAGIEITMVSVTGKKPVTGSHGITVESDILFEEIDGEAQMLVLPGGMPGTLALREHAGLADMLKDYLAKGKWIAAICAAPSVFAGLGFLKEKKATSYPGALQDLPVGEYLEEPVVKDGHIITSRGVGTAIPFALSLITCLKGEEKAQEIASSIVYR